MQVMAPQLARGGIEVVTLRRENPLPYPEAGRGCVLSVERVGQVHGPKPLGEVVLVKMARPVDLRAQRFDEAARQHRYPILRSLAVADGELPAREVDVLDSQAAAFQDT